MAEVGCAGILVADTFCGPMAALPQAGELVAIQPFRRSSGGCAANVAIDLARQGVSVEVAGCLGRDVAGEIVLKGLQSSGVGCDRIAYTKGAPTSETVILLVAGQDRRFIHHFGANAQFSLEHLDANWISQLKVFYLGGLFALPAIDLQALAALLEHCRSHGVVTVLDVVIPQEFTGSDDLGKVLRHTDYFLPNDDEARIITSESAPPEQLRALRELGARNTIITCGREGVVACGGGRIWELSAYPADAVDSSGAGDAFCSGIITGIVNGWALPQMLRYASVLGATATQALGTTEGVVDGGRAQALADAWPAQATAAIGTSPKRAPVSVNIKIKMPDFGTTSSDVTLLRWFVSLGQRIERGQPLMEIETDKATMPVESIVTGVVKEFLVDCNQTVEVGQVVVLIEVEGPAAPPSGPAPPSDSTPAVAAAEQPKTSAPPATSATPRRGALFTRNRAEKLADGSGSTTESS